MKFGDSTLNRGQSIRLVAGLSHFTHLHYMQYSIAVCSRPEVANHVICSRYIRLIVRNNFVVFAKAVLEKFDQKPSKAAFAVVFSNFSVDVRAGR